MSKTVIDPNKIYRAKEVMLIMCERFGIAEKTYYRYHHKKIPGWYFASAHRRLNGLDLIAYIDRVEKQKSPWQRYARDKKSND